MNFARSNAYDDKFVKPNMMGPNTMKILEEMSSSLSLHEGMKILDLGCGCGLSSIFWQKNLA